MLTKLKVEEGGTKECAQWLPQPLPISHSLAVLPKIAKCPVSPLPDSHKPTQDKFPSNREGTAEVL